MAGRAGATVAVPIDFEDDGKVAPTRAQEVAVQRVRETHRLDGGRGGEQALRRHLPAVQGLARPVVGVPAVEEIAVEPLEGQQGG